MGMILDRIGLLVRRGLAWWIDAFLAAAVIVVARWAINALADAPLTTDLTRHRPPQNEVKRLARLVYDLGPADPGEVAALRAITISC